MKVDFTQSARDSCTASSSSLACARSINVRVSASGGASAAQQNPEIKRKAIRVRTAQLSPVKKVSGLRHPGERCGVANYAARKRNKNLRLIHHGWSRRRLRPKLILMDLNRRPSLFGTIHPPAGYQLQ